MTQWSLGVDLGTSFSAAAIATADQVELLDIGGDRRIPSAVLLDDSGRLLAGVVAQRMIGRSPERAERNPKRYVGRGPMLLGGQSVAVEDALAALLDVFVVEARRRFDGADPERVVLTHPVAWNEAQRRILLEAAGRVLRSSRIELLEEPVAAAVFYAHEHRLGGSDSVAVYDLGGGTFDTAVLSVGRTGFDVVGRPGGDPDIGGEAFDERVYRHFGGQLERLAPAWWEQVRTGLDRRALSASAGLLTEARRAKESLSDYDSASQYVQGADVDVHITRTELDALIGDDIRRTARLLADTISGSGRDASALRGIYLTGGASRIPLVQQSLRSVYDGRVRTWQDPKTVVALGAARWSRRSLDVVSPAPAAPAAPVTAAAAAKRESPFPAIATGVLHAELIGPSGYLWCADGGGHRIRRVDIPTGRVDRELAMGQIVAWAVSDELVLIAERRDATVRLHVLSPELIILSTRELPTERDPMLVIEGTTGWVFLRGTSTRDVDNTTGLPWGDDGPMNVMVVRPSTAFAPANLREESVGNAAFWYVNEDGVQRRLLDLTGPTSSVPALLGDGSCVTVMGRYDQKRGSRRRPGEVTPRQMIGQIGSDGRTKVIAEQKARGADVPWVHQVLRPGWNTLWFLATNNGLETFGDLRRGANRLLFMARPRGGAVRWVDSGSHMFGVAMEQVVPNRGLTLHVLVGDRRRDLGRWPGLLGNLASVRHTDAARVRSDGKHLWVGADAGDGSSSVLRVDPEAAVAVASAPGWLEPVGSFDGVPYGLHAPGVRPGDGRSTPASLVRLIS